MNIFKTFFICFSLIISSFIGHSQDSDWKTYKKKNNTVEPTKNQLNDTTKKELNYNGKEGNVSISQDSNIDSLTNQIGREPFINGYTIQIEVSQQKSIIRNSRSLFIRHNPDMPLDEEYDQPNTYLFAGRFYDKNSAYEFKKQIKSDFPDAIVIKKKMNLPPLKK